MNILAIDSSNKPLSIALIAENKIQATKTITTNKKHAEQLLPIIDDLMNVANLKPNELNRIVVAKGPGSYTGIRIGVTAAKVLANTLNIDLVAVSSLETLVLNVQSDDTLVVPMFDVRNDNVFTGLYEKKNKKIINLIKDQHINIDDWLEQLKLKQAKIIFIGTDIINFKSKILDYIGDNANFVNGIDNLPQASNLAFYGSDKEVVKNINELTPDYLRLTKAEVDWKKTHPKEVNKKYVEKA
ncbi:tRNA (adenosine(37)-N6)-threonylcarbamoyltransferase complex dimerization subunit type 1 TsaB [Lactobacillus sp. S2-2]|uniref:tRNA (adenosine(37)-N6)-threonylcarbamoyltransferase complex dimerization subunit type 1 TsaB n=1 Tax=Lactobacillus sp. S2-2 TaxID=2692917 RepID=UPI001F029579|nr:tRNA (adenosine(37)-N6)-threonylcarbamoyltransferase complex dimerization subunit type 1 TsaB [Lactobacillus sp. S2-2]MCF6515667.1 tRNA (adenosine(37)-N6)-threonylcarbamoyltransferase complex dimerization subunit type 1 TsaB [Lactobacillus sp. S2-2]